MITHPASRWPCPGRDGLIAALVAVIAIGFSKAMAEVPDPGDQVITRRDIDDAAITRLGDILDLVRGWESASVDGFAWGVSRHGATAPTDAAHVVIVDGVPMRTGVFGRAELNRLPLDVSEVDTVFVQSNPYMTAGRVHTRGVIRIVTQSRSRTIQRRPSPSAGNSSTSSGLVAVRGRFANGSETNDPGPWLFTEHRTPNVDRIGSASTVQVEGTVRGGVGLVRVVDQSHIASDPALARRLRSISGGRSPEIYTQGGALTGSWPTRGVRVAASRLRNDDFHPLDGWGREVPVRVVTTNASITTSRSTTLGHVSALVTASESERDTRWTTRGLDLDARERDLSVSASVRSARGIGLGAHVGWLDARATNVTATRMVFDLSAELHVRAVNARVSVLAALLGVDAGTPGHVVEARAIRALGRAHRVSVRACVSVESSRRRLDAREWVQLGHAAYRSADVDVDVVSAGNHRDIGADVRWVSTMGAGVTVDANAFVHRVDAPRVSGRVWSYVERDNAMEADRVVFDRLEDQTIGGVGAGAAWRARDRRVTVSGRAWDGASSVPRRRWLVMGASALGAGLDVSIRLEWRDGVRWTEYADVDRLSDGRFSGRMPSVWRGRVSLRKALADGRVSVALTIRNLFDEPVRTHPLGSTERRGVYLDLRAAWAS